MRIMLAFLALALLVPATAYASKDMDMRALHDFCKDDDRAAPPAPGKQFTGDAADPAVMVFKAGEYKLDDAGSTLVLNTDGSYVLSLGSGYNPVFGSDGDDMMKGRVLGGCTREQLSEVLSKNKIIDAARKAVPADSGLQAAAEAAAKEKAEKKQ